MSRSPLCAAAIAILVFQGCALTPKRTQFRHGGTELVSHNNLGRAWCLLEVDSAGQSIPRAQIREASLADWSANSSTVEGDPANADSCDAGPFVYRDPHGVCSSDVAGDNPALELTNGIFPRISITHLSDNQFVVAIKTAAGSELVEFGHPIFDAVLGNSAGKYKWLYSAGVPWKSSDVTYDVYIYLVDDPTARDLPKNYRVEFFRTNKTECVKGEPNPPAGISGPLAVGRVCATSYKESVLEAPIGDGHHGTPVAGVCQY